METIAPKAQKRLRELFQWEERKHFAEKVMLLRALEARFGFEVADVVAEARGELVEATWADIAARAGGSAIEDLVRLLWEENAELFDFTIERRENGDVQLHVTRCFFQELAASLEATDWGYLLFCADDPHIVAGFNPELGFRRTRTLMEGDDHCDHCYFRLSTS